MTVYTVTSINGLGAKITTNHYSADKAEAERGRRLMAGHTNVSLDTATISNKTATVTPPTARAGLMGVQHA